MNSLQRAIVALCVVAGLLMAFPGLVYLTGLAKVDGRPAPADPARFSRETIVATWARCGERGPVAVDAVNPWTYATTLLFDPLAITPGSIAAWRIAARHNGKHPMGNMLSWHTSGAALSVWIRRHWSAEQIGATLVRDDLCSRVSEVAG